MATAPQNNSSTFLWIILMALGFLLGKACNSSGKEIQYIYQTDAPSVPDSGTNTVEQNGVRLITEKVRPARIYHRGPRGGCYYITESGNKVYVDRTICD